jgi:hypothetical protein
MIIIYFILQRTCFLFCNDRQLDEFQNLCGSCLLLEMSVHDYAMT